MDFNKNVFVGNVSKFMFYMYYYDLMILILVLVLFYVYYYDFNIFPLGEKTKLNMYQAIGSALDLTLESDPTAGIYLA